MRQAFLPLLICTMITSAIAQVPDYSSLAALHPGRTAAQNALWIENPEPLRFDHANPINIADIRGPATITMVHFAMPERMKLNRDVILRAWWDGEASPSIECPLVDFFCDPAGLRDVVNSALVNKRQGFNAYFPMPFRKSARLELEYDGQTTPSWELWRTMPCYSYVMYREEPEIADDQGYFHACWRQEALVLGKQEYAALRAVGDGKFVGWNVTVRLPGRGGYPVDMNEKFYIDGETSPSIELQGIEDSFGFSYGFPPTENMFPLTGYFPFYKGAAAYRFFINDAIRFRRSLNVDIGFGEKELGFKRDFSRARSRLELSNTAYWYQKEPHAELPPLPPADKRAPAPEDDSWRRVFVPSDRDIRTSGIALLVLCGSDTTETVYAEPGYSYERVKGYAYDGWLSDVFYCRADEKELQLRVHVPARSAGKLRLFAIDPDLFQGGRSEEVFVGRKSLGTIDAFEQGRWLETQLSPEETADGVINIRAVNRRPDGASNAVLSIIQWIPER